MRPTPFWEMGETIEGNGRAGVMGREPGRDGPRECGWDMGGGITVVGEIDRGSSVTTLGRALVSTGLRTETEEPLGEA